MSSRLLFSASLLGVLVSLLVAFPVQAEVTVNNLLPTGLRWQSSDYEVPYSVWAERTSAGIMCRYAISSTDPWQCRDTQYIWDSNHQIRVGGTTYQCHRVALPDTCSTGTNVPEAQRSQARCTTARVHTSEQEAVDTRLCAACTGSSCDFFLGTGPISKDGGNSTNTPAPTQTQPPASGSDAPITSPSPNPGNGSGGNGTGGAGNGNGEVNNVPDAVLENPLNSDSLEDLLLSFLRGIVRIGVIALLLFLVYVGFQFVAAQGNEEKLRTARNALIWTVVGGVILLGAEVIMGVIQATMQSLAI